MQRIDQVQLSTLGACGDVNRNVMCCPAPYSTPAHQQLQELAEKIALNFAARSGAYREIWLEDTETGERQRIAGDETAE